MSRVDDFSSLLTLSDDDVVFLSEAFLALAAGREPLGKETEANRSLPLPEPEKLTEKDVEFLSEVFQKFRVAPSRRKEASDDVGPRDELLPKTATRKTSPNLPPSAASLSSPFPGRVAAAYATDRSLFEPDILLRDQFSVRSGALVSREKRLMLAVLENALDSYQKYVFAKDGQGRQMFDAAVAWLNSPDTEWPFSYLNICETLDINPEYLRRGLEGWRIRAAVAGEAAVLGEKKKVHDEKA